MASGENLTFEEEKKERAPNNYPEEEYKVSRVLQHTPNMPKLSDLADMHIREVNAWIASVPHSLFYKKS